MNSQGRLDKKEYKMVKIKSKLIAKKRLKQFGIFTLIIVPVIIALTIAFDYAKLASWQQILIDFALIFGFFMIYFYGLIKPIEKRQKQIREQKKEEAQKATQEE